MQKEKEKLEQKIAAGLEDGSSWNGRQITIGHLRPNITKMAAAHPELKPQVRQIKQEGIVQLEQLLPQAIAKMEENGFKVHLASDNQEAAEYIAALVGERIVVKSKSNTGKEIDLTNRLQRQGAEVYETDLGDRLAQLEGKGKSAHTLAPAAHLTKEDCAALLSADIGQSLEADAKVLVAAARKRLRNVFLQAEVGISGANAIAAENGSIFLTENEGNIRCVTSIPKLHIVVAGIEKIVPKITDGLTVVKGASTYGCGQDIGTYVSIIAGVGTLGPEEVHVVLLEQGRQEAIDQGYEEVLYCLNCGGCLNTCPVYRAIGDQFGYKYLGGRGAVFTAFHSLETDKAEEAGLSLCIGCGRCLESCPVEMETPQMVLRLRQQEVAEHGLGLGKRSAFQLLASNPLAPLTRAGRHLQGLALQRQENNGAVLRLGLDGLGVPGMPKSRLFPQLAEHSLAELLQRRSPLARPKGRVALFAGCLANYVDPQLGLDVFDVLMANGIELVMHGEESCCGLPALMSGDKVEAAKLAKHNIRLFARDEVEYILFVCPSCATTVKEKWAELVADCPDEQLRQQYQAIQAKVMDINAYLFHILQIKPPALPEQLKVTYHDPCHLVRGLHICREPRELLRQLGTELVEMQEADSCCGFGGSFSLFHYNVSRKINDEKIDDILATGADTVVTSCPGCMMHIRDGLYQGKHPQQVVHSISLIAQAYRQGGENHV